MAIVSCLSFNCRPTVHLLNKRKDGHQQLMQLRKEGLKKYRLAGIRTQTSAIPVQHSNQLCYRANWSLNCWPFVGRPSPRCRRSGLLASSWSTVDVGVIGTSRYCANHKHSEHFCTRLPFPLTNFREGLKALSSEKSFISMYTKLRSCLSHWRRAGVVEHLLK